MNLYYDKNLKTFSQENRRTLTSEEGLVRHCILKKHTTGYRFLRQKPILDYIIDFYCPKLKLGVEIDGESHEYQFDYDLKRTKDLNKFGIKIVRYTNKDVMKNLEGVALDINQEIRLREKELNN